MSKIIILGMNRTGTKLASYLMSKSFNLPNVFLEPFTWDKGINSALSEDWQPQQKLRNRNPIAIQEHKKLNIISKTNDESKWLEDILNDDASDIIKLIEIGRSALYERYNPNAFFISLIRDPLEFLQSINGMRPARHAVVEQWQRLMSNEGIQDPLPDADRYLSKELADCVRAYFILYKHLKTFHPKNYLKISYQQLITHQTPFEEIEYYLNRHAQKQSFLPTLGSSTKTEIDKSQSDYIKAKLTPIYESFLE